MSLLPSLGVAAEKVIGAGRGGHDTSGGSEIYNPYCDPTSPFYDETLCAATEGGSGGNGTTSTSTGSGGDTTVNVTVNTGVAVTNQIGQELADAVNTAIADAANQASVIAQNTAQEISSGISNTVNQIEQSANSFFGGVGDFFKQLLSSLGSSVGQILSTIGNSIGDIATKIGASIANAIGPILSQIPGIIQQVVTFYNTTIAPILNGIQQAMVTISAMTTAIERDLNNGFAGILQLPGDIANSLGSLESTLNNVMNQLGINLNGIVTTTIGGTQNDTLWTRLKTLGDGLTGVPGASKMATTFQASVKVPEPDLQQVAQQAVSVFEGIWKQAFSFIGQLSDSEVKLATEGLNDPTGLLNVALAAGLHLGFVGLASIGEALPIVEYLRGYCNSKLGLAKLATGDALQAWVRGFITTDILAAELGFQGLDAERIQVLKDLQNYLIDIDRIIDMQFRGIVTPDDVVQNAKEHGITSDDLTALQAAAFKLFPVDLATTALRWDLITDDQHTDALKENRYTDAQIAAVKATLYQHESSDQVITRERITALYSELGFSDPAFSSVPDELAKAVQREGGDNQVALDKWQASYWVPTINEAIELYFRGYFTLPQTIAVFDYYAVPEQLRNNLIHTRESLIPWRTIPTMLADGIINEAYAKQQLAAHGFPLPAQEALLGYAQVAKKASTKNQLGNPLTTSLTAAKELWTMGAFTDAQYAEALQAHGYTADEANTIIQADVVAEHAKQRKQAGTDIVNEVQAGLLTMDQANQQMTQLAFTDAERGRVLKAIAKVRKATVKIPAEAELTKMVEKGALTFADWSATMALLGYAQKWIDAYAKLNFGSVTGPAVIQPSVGTFS